MNAVSVIAQASTTGKANSRIGLITSRGDGIRRTWKLDGKQIAFDKLYKKLMEA